MACSGLPWYNHSLSFADNFHVQGNQVFIKEHALFLQSPDMVFGRFYEADDVEPLALVDRSAPKSAHTNPSMLPDSLLLSVQPIFQIRHPILMFPSMLRAQMKTMGPTRPSDMRATATFTLHHSRALFDWYDKQGSGLRPQVIDADDIMSGKDSVRHLCIETGMDPDAVLYEWETRVEEDPLKAHFLSTINASKGILPGLAARGLDLEVEKGKWKAEFGETDGEDLAQFVADAMADYNYLLSRRTYVASVESP